MLYGHQMSQLTSNLASSNSNVTVQFQNNGNLVLLEDTTLQIDNIICRGKLKFKQLQRSLINNKNYQNNKFFFWNHCGEF